MRGSTGAVHRALVVHRASQKPQYEPNMQRLQHIRAYLTS